MVLRAESDVFGGYDPIGHRLDPDGISNIVDLLLLPSNGWLDRGSDRKRNFCDRPCRRQPGSSRGCDGSALTINR